MSDNIDLTNNLCVTEDAFERFQAETVYEEPQLITLSDIVPAPQPALYLTAGSDGVQDDVFIIDDPDPQPDENTVSESVPIAKNLPLNTTNTLTARGHSQPINDSVTQYIQDVSKEIIEPTPIKIKIRRKSSYVRDHTKNMDEYDSPSKGTSTISKTNVQPLDTTNTFTVGDIHSISRNYSVIPQVQGGPKTTLEPTIKKRIRRKSTYTGEHSYDTDVNYKPTNTNNKTQDIPKTELEITPIRTRERRKSTYIGSYSEDIEECYNPTEASKTQHVQDVSKTVLEPTPIKKRIRRKSMYVGGYSEDGCNVIPLKKTNVDTICSTISDKTAFDGSILQTVYSELDCAEVVEKPVKGHLAPASLVEIEAGNSIVATDDTQKPRKRGRKRKNTSGEELITSEANKQTPKQQYLPQHNQEDINVAQIQKRTPKKTARAKSIAKSNNDNKTLSADDNELSAISVIDNRAKTPRRKPGRPKKQNNLNLNNDNELALSKTVSSNCIIDVCQQGTSEIKVDDKNITQNSKLKTKKVTKRTARAKSMVALEDNNSFNFNNDLSLTTVLNNTTEIPRKRPGRPKKQKALKNDNEVTSNSESAVLCNETAKSKSSGGKKRKQESENKMQDSDILEKTTKQPAKRFARAKSTIIFNDNENSFNIDTVTTVLDSKKNTLKKQRGRPKKQDKSTYDKEVASDSKAAVLHSSTSQNSSPNSNTNITKQMCSENKLDDNISLKSPVQASKRIRRAKSMFMFSNEDETDNSFNIDNNLSKVSRKKGSKRKPGGLAKEKKKGNYNKSDLSTTETTENIKQQEPVTTPEKKIDNKYDEIERQLERLLSTPTNIHNENENKQVDNTQSVLKKRGRKPKKQLVESQYVEEKQIDIEERRQISDDEGDDICLSYLKKKSQHEVDQGTINTINDGIPLSDSLNKLSDVNKEQSPNKHISEHKAVMSQFERNIKTLGNDSINQNLAEENVTETDTPEIENPSKRPVRRKVKKVLHYDEGSDEDPFANIELSDDDDLSGGKYGRYLSDEEYIPGKRKRGNKYSESSLSESDDLEELEDLEKDEDSSSNKQLHKMKGRKSDEKSQKTSKTHDLTLDMAPDVTSTAADTTTEIDEDNELSLQSPDTTNENTTQRQQVWGKSHEFENFLAKKIQGTNLQIKKLSGTAPNPSAITPLQIPVLDPNEPKKVVAISTQTITTPNKTVAVQTSTPYDSTMKTKVSLTADQSERACEFLKGIVTTTSELGQLMIQKSEDFIKKKINTSNVTDTSKMDYCVQKSFLLFKLAKHNLIQMEEDLANAYEQFLRTNDMLQYRESPKCITATPKPASSDSDCEIVEEPIPQKEKEKSKFNLKTVFLNKELSIKIAKKSTEEPQTNKEKLNVKGRHTVWINDSIMVKKVKPTQSFLAQDSRNKKPPDTYVTIEMVKTYFDNYFKRQQALSACAPFVSPHWLNVRQISACNYFIAQSSDLATHSRVLLTTQLGSESSNGIINNGVKGVNTSQPISLQTLCTKVLQKYMYRIKIDVSNENNHHVESKQQNHPKTLSRLSLNLITHLLAGDEKVVLKNLGTPREMNTLKVLSLKIINEFIHKPLVTRNLPYPEKLLTDVNYIFLQNINISGIKCDLMSSKRIKSNVKTLFSSCVEIIQKSDLSVQKCDNLEISRNEISLNKIKSLKCIAFDKVKQSLYTDFRERHNSESKPDNCSGTSKQTAIKITDICSENEYCVDEADSAMVLTIESVNTLTDDIFSKLPNSTTVLDKSVSLENDDSNSFSNYESQEHEYEECSQENNLIEESNWVSRVQLQEFKSCFMPINDNTQLSVTSHESIEEYTMAQIKIEPLDIMTENIDSLHIKTEPVENDDEITNIQTLETKLERPDYSDNIEDNLDNTPECTSNSYDVNAFESFARTSKMLQAASNYRIPNDEVFSQSALRVRRQHEPDMDDEFDTSMSLLIPQQSIEVAKDRLMESSSDDGTGSQKNITKKKRKIRSKGTRLKLKDLSINKDKSTDENEVAVLTKKLQDKIRQEEKKVDSSDSELESSLALRRENSKRVGSDKLKRKIIEEVDSQIQCSDVDSTENINDNADLHKNKIHEKKDSKHFGCYKTAANNILDTNNATGQKDISSFVIQPDAPVELLECEPILPMMHDDMENMGNDNDNVNQKSDLLELKQEPPYIVRHGWRCFPVNNSDNKLYEHAHIVLERLPDTFVDTYFRYQGMSDKNKDDTEVDRLTNLQSLHRNSSKDNKVRSKTNKELLNGQLKPKGAENNSSRPSSPTKDSQCDEFSLSEDEGPNIDDEVAPSAPSQYAVENDMAKNCLMNDMDSDPEKSGKTDHVKKPKKSIKKETMEEPSNLIETKRSPTCGSNDGKDDNSMMLTADKMMNKELALLHAPVTLNDDPDVKDTPKKNSAKNLTRNASKLQTHLERAKAEDDSSSEEEKQWVNTKEKLLKRMGKKQDNPSLDDAKRAKIVSEFIERRGDAPENRSRVRPRNRRITKKFLERQKQMSVLNKELYGEADASYTGRKHSQTLGKGRKNIRKVIDKKLLARSTVIANMEEFERKRRLNIQQTRLREQLGFEEGVNVLVINDEVCLEYNFEQMCPTVTVHPFFTKVMKAHQYEGVKFMWDACFESLEKVQSGHPGGGCILAHCMGLGKTLQVLALLHTVLTHSSVGMHRVLVCCPLSTVLNWVDEIHKWIGPVTSEIKVFELSKLKKTYERAYQLEDWYKGGGIFIIGYELFRSLTTLDPLLDDIRPTIVKKIRNALLDPGPDVVICDEGHLLKNDASVLAVAMSRVATRRRIILTGTPMQNNLREYYCMVNFVKPSLLGSYAEYSNRFENPIMNGQHRDSQEEDIKLMKARTHILHKVLEGCLQRQEASVLYPYLPKKHEYTVFIPPTKCQWDLYKHYISTYAVQQNQKQSILKDFHVLQKIWTHPQVLHNFLMKDRDERQKIKAEKLEDDLAQEDLAASEDIKPSQTEVWWLQYLEGGGMLDCLESSNKFMVVFYLLEECIALGDKILIFSTSLYTMDALEYFLKRINKWSLGQEYYRLDGSVPPEVRQKWCREFNAENNLNTKLFLISTRAGCLGLNMTAANRVIILDTSWNPAHDIQSIFRVYRFGQKKDCYIYRLVAMGTMEQKIYERSVAKQAVSCRVVDEQQIDRHYNMAELTELYRFDEEGASVEAGLAAGVSDVALLRVAARARLHAVREHDSLLRGSREQHLPEHERNAAWMQFQEEHAHTEMQNRLMEASQGIQKMLEADLAKLARSIEIKTEIDVKPQLTTPQVVLKGKKGKKSEAKSEEDPNKSQQRSSKKSEAKSEEDSCTNHQRDIKLDPETEESKVKKIMGLLIKHNFHTTRQAQEVAELVTNVRKIVDGGGVGLEESDELTRSIATVLLQEEDAPAPMSSSMHIISGNLNNSSGHQVEVKLEPTDAYEKVNEPLTVVITPDINGSQSQIKSEPVNTKADQQINDTKNTSSITLITKRQRGRPRKYAIPGQCSIPEGNIKRPRGRPRKSNVTDNEDSSSMDDEAYKTLCTKTYSDSRPRRNPKRSYASEVDEVLPACILSKESSPGGAEKPVNEPLKKEVKQTVGVTSGEETTSIDVDDYDDNKSKRNKATIVIDEPEDLTETQTSKSNKKTRAALVPEDVISLETNTSGKVKRRAALAAKQHLETLHNDDVITLDDGDDEWVDSTSASEAKALYLSFKRKPAHSVEKKSTSKKVDKQTNKDQQKQNDSSINCDSILLTDDDDTVGELISTKENTVNEEPEQVVPLPVSLLSNVQFIKVVSNAYQSNRMLDEDAALLAAQYSTQKALKEIQSGKSITSGPLYDIAFDTLGKIILKKLYEQDNYNQNTNNKDKESPKTKKSVENSTDSEKNKSNQGKSKVTSKEKKRITVPDGSIKKKMETSVATASNLQPDSAAVKVSAPSPQPSISKVVPVGMFMGLHPDYKGAVFSVNQRVELVEECILPDDDDEVIIGPNKKPSSSTTNIYKKPNSQPLVITSVSSSKKPNTSVVQTTSSIEIIDSDSVQPNLPKSQPQTYLTISNGKLVSSQALTAQIHPGNEAPVTSVPSSTPVPPVLTNPGATPSPFTSPPNDTICLDSDEEDVADKVPKTHVPATSLPPSQISTVTPVPAAVSTNMVNNFTKIPNGKKIPVLPRLNEPETPPPETKVQAINQQQKVVTVPGLPDKLNKQKTDSDKKTNKAASTPNLLEDDPTVVHKLCKPGDIVRITKTGNLEVLTKVDKLPNKVVKSQVVSERATMQTDLKVVKEVRTQDTVAEKRKLSAPSSAGSSRPSNDPLSILNDVIHIQADEYDEPVRTKTSKIEQPNLVNYKNTKNYSGSSRDESKKPLSKVLSNLNTSKGKSEEILKFTFVKNNKSSAVQSINKESKSKVSGSSRAADLIIDIPYGDPPKPSKKPKSTSTVVVGSSKDIILRPKHKTEPKLSSKASTTNNFRLEFRNDKNAKSSSPSQYFGNKKRVSPWPEVNAAKKKKRPTMTLKDFNIDDIDDIIELE